MSLTEKNTEFNENHKQLNSKNEVKFQTPHSAVKKSNCCIKHRAICNIWIALIIVVASAVGIILVVLYERNSAHDSIELQVIDLVNNALDVKYKIRFESTNSNLYTILEAYQQLSHEFKFSVIRYNASIVKITSVNGLTANKGKSGLWVLGKRSRQSCISVDPNTYIPHYDDTIILAYVTADMAHNFFSCFDSNVKSIKISITNYVPDIAFTNVSYGAAIESHGTLIEVMEKLQKKNKNFWFETVEYPNLGKLITLINGLEQNTEKKTYWALGKKIEDKLCLLSVGASSYYPKVNEHIAFAYITYDMFNNFESCDGGSTHDSMNVQISVQNTIGNVTFVNASYNIESKMNTILINLMKKLNKTNNNFSFTTIEYTGLGEMITSINGLEQNSITKTYWSIGKMVEGKMCLFSVGASSYYPNPDEHIILAYIPIDMFNILESCDGGRSHDSLNVQISVQNTINNVDFVNASYNTESKMNTSLINIMKELNKTNNNFSFTTIEYTGLGEMITSINGLEQNSKMKTYWSIRKMVEGKMCHFSVGASSYYPQPDEHIIFAYIPIDMFNILESCDGGSTHDSMNVQISVQNTINNVDFVNASYNMESKMNTSLINIMKELNKTNNNFSFTTIEYTGLGEMIKSINGLEQNSTMKTYWSIGKMVEGKMCLFSVGASSYYPQPDEHIIFAYIPIDMFNILESCEGGSTHDSMNVQISVQNTINNVDFVNASYNMESKMNTSLINIMKELNKTNNNFSFTTIEYTGLGEMIKSINGLEQNSTMKTYWSIGKMVEGKMCLFSVGASSYYPEDEDEHIIFLYITYDRKFPSCDKSNDHQSAESHIVSDGIVLGVQNLVEYVSMENASYAMESTLNGTTMLELLKQLNNTNSNFSFTTQTLSQDFRIVITSVNGFWQNSDYFWAPGKSVNGDICLISEGIDVFTPSQRDYILLMFSNVDTYGGLPYCQVTR